jgi:hypothetical protein
MTTSAEDNDLPTQLLAEWHRSCPELPDALRLHTEALVTQSLGRRAAPRNDESAASSSQRSRPSAVYPWAFGRLHAVDVALATFSVVHVVWIVRVVGLLP